MKRMLSLSLVLLLVCIASASGQVRFGGEGIWVAISRDPETGVLRAASHNRNNSAAVAY